MRIAWLAVALVLALAGTGTATGANHKPKKPRARGAQAAAVVPAAAPVVVAVVDSGVDASHPLLAAHLLPGVNLHDGGTSDDTSGHGSHVAGIVVQDDPAAQILPLKITDGGTLDLPAAARAIRYAADHGAKVINLSWVYMGQEPEVHDAIVYAGLRGALVVTAAGNWSWNLDISGGTWPADESTLSNVVTVAATCDGSTLAPFSNYGFNVVNVAALGCDISSAWLDGSLHLLSGTSMAAPRVAAAAAALFAKDPSASPAAIKQALIASCTPSAGLTADVACGGSI
jgi:subtilisin family serine protease